MDWWIHLQQIHSTVVQRTRRAEAVWTGTWSHLCMPLQRRKVGQQSKLLPHRRQRSGLQRGLASFSWTLSLMTPEMMITSLATHQTTLEHVQ